MSEYICTCGKRYDNYHDYSRHLAIEVREAVKYTENMHRYVLMCTDGNKAQNK